jgi:hypothetical protein
MPKTDSSFQPSSDGVISERNLGNHSLIFHLGFAVGIALSFPNKGVFSHADNIPVKCFARLLLAQITILFALAGPFDHLLTSSDDLVQIKRAAEAGDPAAQTKLGEYYHRSFMVAAAARWYEAAATQGYPPALSALGNLCAAGGGIGTNHVVANHTNAFQLHRLAAVQGYQQSQYSVGMYYREGNIVPRNLVLAYKHLKLSNTGMAKEYLKQLVLQMSQDQITEAEKQVAQFRPIAFRQAFEDLVFDSIKLQGIFASGADRGALINGKSIRAGQQIPLTIAGLPATLKCESIRKDSVTLSLGSSRREIAVGAKLAHR